MKRYYKVDMDWNHGMVSATDLVIAPDEDAVAAYYRERNYHRVDIHESNEDMMRVARKYQWAIIDLTREDEAEDEYVGPFVDMSIEEFEELYAPPKDEQLTMAEHLNRALRRARYAAQMFRDHDDGGTSNFDSPTLDFAACGLKRKDAESVIRDLGMTCFDWKPFKNHRDADGKLIKAPVYLVIGGFQSGQGYRHTKMSEAFCNSMNRDGFESGMYYQMD